MSLITRLDEAMANCRSTSSFMQATEAGMDFDKVLYEAYPKFRELAVLADDLYASWKSGELINEGNDPDNWSNIERTFEYLEEVLEALWVREDGAPKNEGRRLGMGG